MIGDVGESKARGAEVAHPGVRTLKVGGVEAGSVVVVHADGRVDGKWREVAECTLFDSGIFTLK